MAGDLGVELVIPDDGLPTLLIDFRWMEQLLANLVRLAITGGIPGGRIELRVNSGREHCRIDIKSTGSLPSEMALIRRLARQLKLQIETDLSTTGSYRIGIANIKIR